MDFTTIFGQIFLNRIAYWLLQIMEDLFQIIVCTAPMQWFSNFSITGSTWNCFRLLEALNIKLYYNFRANLAYFADHQGFGGKDFGIPWCDETKMFWFFLLCQKMTQKLIVNAYEMFA